MTRTMKRLIALGASVMLLAAMAGPVSADNHGTGAGVIPTEVNRIAGQAGAGQWACEGGTKIEDPADGTYYANFSGFPGSITIDVYWTEYGWEFDWETDQSGHYVTTVLVKGGPNALLYTYGGSQESDTGLHAPYNENSGYWYGLSHLCFKTLKKGA